MLKNIRLIALWQDWKCMIKMNKQELMKQLIDLYQQREFVKLPCTQIIIDQYIKKLELKLKALL